MPFPSTPESRDRRRRAYELLGVQPNAVADAPKIGHLIAKLKDGKATALEALRASDLPEARKFISKYDNIYLPSYVRKTLPFEAFCIAAGISPTRMFGVIAEVIRLQKSQLGAIKAAERHEAIVEVSSQAALNPAGVDDRMAHLKHMGFTPSPRGSTINIGVSATANAAAKSDATAAALPAPEDTIRRIVEARQRAALPGAIVPQLPAAAVAESIPRAFERRTRDPVTVDAEYSDAGDAEDSAEAEAEAEG
jgi:hypothetical protein